MNTWQQMTGWKLVIPPSRPDTLDLRRIADHVRVIDRSLPVAVLGSTPEFRDLLHELGFEEVHVLERDVTFHELVSEERIYQNSETLVEGDWLETVPVLQDHFGLVLSDLTSGNVSWTDRSHFYTAVGESLIPGGLFIDKVLSNPEGVLSLSDLEKRYAYATPNLQTLNYFSCEAVFCSDLQLERQLIDTSWIYEELSSAFRSPRLAALIYGAQAITPLNCVWYYGKLWSELRDDYCADLELLAKYDLNPSQPYFGRAHQYVWQRAEVK